jgi:hypothetical protein
MSNNGPTFTKATYDSKRHSRDPTSPERRMAAIEQAGRDADKSRNFRRRMKEDIDGLIKESFGSIEEYLKRHR